MHYHTTIENPDSWRNHSFIIQVLAELPLIGSFFAKEHPLEMLDMSLKYLTMLVVSTAGMMVPMGNEMDDSPATMGAKMAFKMSVGMSVGNMGYNVARKGAKSFYYRFFGTPTRSSHSPPVASSQHPETDMPYQRL